MLLASAGRASVNRGFDLILAGGNVCAVEAVQDPAGTCLAKNVSSVACRRIRQIADLVLT